MSEQRREGKVTVGEIFELLKNSKTKKERVEILNTYKENLGVKTILRLQFDPRFTFALPEGSPPNLKSKDIPSGMGTATLMNAVRQFYIFLKGAAKVRQVQREALFVELLESLDNKERALLLDVKDKKLDVGLTRKIVDEVFPGLIPSDTKGAQDDKGAKKASDNTSV